MSGHVLKCQHCGRRFTAMRRDAIGCSRSCRRHLEKAAKAAELPQAPQQPAAAQPLIATDELEGWRRLPGGLLAPPPDPRHTFYVDPDQLRRL